MIYMLDTNICIYILNKQPISYIERLTKIELSNKLAISSIVLAELQYGVANSISKEKNQIKLNALISKFDILDFSANCALYYGELRADLKKQGVIIGNNDLLIASHALCEKAMLVTNNISEFSRCKGLMVENWAN